MNVLVLKTDNTSESKNPVWLEKECRIKIFFPQNKLIKKGEKSLVKTGFSFLWPEGVLAYITKEKDVINCPTFINKSEGMYCTNSKEIEVLVYNPFSFDLEIQKNSSLCDIAFLPSINGISLVSDFFSDFSSCFLRK